MAASGFSSQIALSGYGFSGSASHDIIVDKEMRAWLATQNSGLGDRRLLDRQVPQLSVLCLQGNGKQRKGAKREKFGNFGNAHDVLLCDLTHDRVVWSWSMDTQS
jgi:hypothetical protein